MRMSLEGLKASVLSSLVARFLFLCGVLLTTPSFGLEIRNYDPLVHDRFQDFPTDLSPNTTFFLAAEDWSGFGWNVQDPRKHLTLISNRHFVGARHFRPPVGSQVRFVNRSGIIKTYTVGAHYDILNDEDPARASDLSLGELVETVSAADEVSIVPVYNLAAEEDYLGLEIVASGKDSRAGLGEVSEVDDFQVLGSAPILPTRGLITERIDPGSGANDYFLVGGDSGGPSAFQTSSGFALVGIHTAISEDTEDGITTYRNVDSFLPHYLERLDAAMESEGYHVTRFNATSPALSLLMGIPASPVLSSEGSDLQVTISNVTSGVEAHNLRLQVLFEGGTTLASYVGPGWVVESDEGASVVLVRAGLDSGETSDLTLSLQLPAEPTGAVLVNTALSADGSVDLSASETLTVVQSYASWSAGLSEPDPQADSDGDGLSNLFEFAAGLDGGDPHQNELLTFQSGSDPVVVSYQERAFADFLGLGIELETSLDLVNWHPFEGDPAPGLPFNQFQVYSASFASRGKRFFRWVVTGGENLIF